MNYFLFQFKPIETLFFQSHGKCRRHRHHHRHHHHHHHCLSVTIPWLCPDCCCHIPLPRPQICSNWICGPQLDFATVTVTDSYIVPATEIIIPVVEIVISRCYLTLHQLATRIAGSAGTCIDAKVFYE
ncbi:hypothetical protein ABFS83_07G096900 [Erythranthe nasuta]